MASGTAHVQPGNLGLSGKAHETVAEEDQDSMGNVHLEPITVGPAAFGSPDPETSGFSVNVPIEDHPAKELGLLSDDYGAGVGGEEVRPLSSSARAGTPNEEEIANIDVSNDATTKADLQTVAKFYELPVSGDKKALRKRIEEHRKEQEEAEKYEAEVRGLSREELNEEAKVVASENDIEDFDPEHYANVEELQEAVLAMNRGDDPQPGSNTPEPEAQ